MKKILALIVLGAALSTPALAASPVASGSYSYSAPDFIDAFGEYAIGLGYLPYGNYNMTVSATSDIQFADLSESLLMEVVDFHDTNPPTFDDAGESPYPAARLNYAVTHSARSFAIDFTVFDPSHKDYFPDGNVETEYSVFSVPNSFSQPLEISLDGIDPTNLDGSVSYEVFADTPEPFVWALMLCGLGALGLRLRLTLNLLFYP